MAKKGQHEQETSRLNRGKIERANHGANPAAHTGEDNGTDPAEYTADSGYEPAVTSGSSRAYG